MGMIHTPPSVIPNGATINGVCHIYQTTKPTTRPNGSALVAGDIWYNFSTGVNGFWNGVYWLDKNVYQATATGRIEGYSGNTAIISNVLNNKNGIVLKDAAIFFSGVGTHNALNHWNIGGIIYREGNTAIFSGFGVNTIDKTFGGTIGAIYHLETMNFNTYYAGNQFTSYHLNFQVVGTPGLILPHSVVNYWVVL